MTENEKEKKFTENEFKTLNLLYPQSGYTKSCKFCTWDAIHPKRKHVTEIKVRNFGLETFQSSYKGEPLIEVDKYNSLVNKAAELDYKPVYVFGFTNPSRTSVTAFTAYNLASFDFTNYKIEKRLCPKNEFDSNPEYVLKDCYIIPATAITTTNSYTLKF